MLHCGFFFWASCLYVSYVVTKQPFDEYVGYLHNTPNSVRGQCELCELHHEL